MEAGTRVEFTEPMGGTRRGGPTVIVPATVQGVVLRESEVHPGHWDVLTDDMVHPSYGDQFDGVDVPYAHPDQFRVVCPVHEPDDPDCTPTYGDGCIGAYEIASR